MSYQGWENHATWLVYLHITNDEGLYHAVKYSIEFAKECEVSPAEDLQEFVADMLEASICGLHDAELLLKDLLQSVLSSVDWQAIVDSLTGE